MLDFSDCALLELLASGLSTEIHKMILGEMPEPYALLESGKCSQDALYWEAMKEILLLFRFF